MDLKVERDYSLWRVTACTPRGRAVLEALEIADGQHVGMAQHLALITAAQDAGLEVRT